MTFASAKTYVEIPAPVVHQGGFLYNVNLIPAGAHDLMGAEYITDACAPGQTWTDLCYNVDLALCANPAGTDPDPLPEGGLKVFGQPDLVQGEPFAVYDGVECGLTTTTEDEERAKTRLGFSEGRQVDFFISQWMSDNADTDLGALGITAAIMAFEDQASQLYGSYGTISMPRSMAVCARSKDLIFPAANGGLETVNGTQVIAFANETAGLTQEVFLTGRISLIQGGMRSYAVPPVTRPDGTCDPQRALAERMYVPLVECMVVAATATCD